MPKFITPLEISEIVTGLLVKPDLFNELSDQATWEQFFSEITETVARYCGGEVIGLADARNPSEGQQVAAAVLPTDKLRNGSDCVWAAYDEPWTPDELNAAWLEPGQPLTKEDANAKRMAVRSLNLSSTQVSLQDWDTSLTDPAQYNVKITTADNIIMDVASPNDSEKQVFTVLFEVSKGVPAIHLYQGEDESPALHIHAAPQGLVLSPDSDDVQIVRCEPCTHSYDIAGSLLVKSRY
jgi:hypothetical protein